jgi:hypothetical protein
METKQFPSPFQFGAKIAVAGFVGVDGKARRKEPIKKTLACSFSIIGLTS